MILPEAIRTMLNAIKSVFAKKEDIPTKVSELENDSGYITSEDIPDAPVVPTKVSEFENDSGYITSEDIPEVPEPVQSDLAQNDETAPDYVKNRTHYEYFKVLNQVEKTLNASDTTQNVTDYVVESIDGGFSGYVSVKLNGVVYERGVITFLGSRKHEIHDENGNKLSCFPSVYGTTDRKTRRLQLTAVIPPIAESTTVTISHEVLAIEPLAEKFLPDTVRPGSDYAAFAMNSDLPKMPIYYTTGNDGTSSYLYLYKDNRLTTKVTAEELGNVIRSNNYLIRIRKESLRNGVDVYSDYIAIQVSEFEGDYTKVYVQSGSGTIFCYFTAEYGV